MTGAELFEQMLALGGRKGLIGIEDAVWLKSANRALFEVNRLFPVTESIQLLNYPIATVGFYKGITVHKGGEDLEFNASGVRSLAFAVSGGAGKADVLSGGEIIESFSWEQLSSFEVKRCIIDDLALIDLTVRFTGEFNYLLKDISFYADLASDLADDVDVYSPWVRYDLASIDYLGDRFMSFDSRPVRLDGVSLSSPYDYKIEGSAVYLRADEPGIYEVSVMVKPTPIRNADTTEIDVETQLCDLVALRAAYYLYSVTDTEIADRCNSEYQRVLALALSSARKVRTQSRFRNVYKGW